MAKVQKEFFTDNEVLFVGYSIKNNGFSKMIYRAFENNGIKVYPLNRNAAGNHEVKVYKSMEELPKVPKTAFVLLSKTNAAKEIENLKQAGVKRILFQSKQTVDQETLEQCGKMGIETQVACPMMTFGKGLHKVHAFFAGK